MPLGGFSMSGYPINAQQRSGAHQYINAPEFDNMDDFTEWMNMTWAQNNIGRVLEEQLMIDPMGEYIGANIDPLPAEPSNFQTGVTGVNDMTGGAMGSGATTNNQGGVDFTGTDTTMTVPDISDQDIINAANQLGIVTNDQLSGLLTQDDLQNINNALGLQLTYDDVAGAINNMVHGIDYANDPGVQDYVAGQIATATEGMMTGDMVTQTINDTLAAYGLSPDDVIGQQDGEDVTAGQIVTGNATDQDANQIYDGQGSVVGSTTTDDLATETTPDPVTITPTPTPTPTAPTGNWWFSQTPVGSQGDGDLVGSITYQPAGYSSNQALNMGTIDPTKLEGLAKVYYDKAMAGQSIGSSGYHLLRQAAGY